MPTLFGRYEIVDRLGEGAQSTVYLVRDTQNQDALKAAKIIKSENFARNSGEEIISEFQILESIDHPNLVRVFECRFLPEDKAPVLVTEYLPEAWNLEAYLLAKQHAPFAQKVQIAYQILLALSYLHRKKIIHGDLKPSNILVLEGKIPLVKLIDFGVSQDLLIRKDQACVGTPFYIAPEAVAEGLVSASDLYSFGVILYRLLISATLPYEKMTPEEILSVHLTDQPLFPESLLARVELPEPIAELLRQCLEVEPQARPRRLDDLLRGLRMEFHEILAPLPSPTLDVRSRAYLGPPANLRAGENLLRETFGEKATTARPFFFVAAPSGGGKSRYLQELERFCQRQKLHSLLLSYRERDFWDYAFLSLMKEFSQAKTTKKLRGRLSQVLYGSEQWKREALFRRFLQNLALELGGLVLLIDGLPAQIPASFIEMIRALLKGSLRQGKGHAKLLLAMSIHVRTSANDLTNGMSEQVRNLGHEGLARYLV